jgi:anti-sigma factor RsiW
MADCNEMGLTLGALVDGELDGEARLQLESHLVGCATCVARISDYSDLRKELRKIVEIPQLEGFAKSVLEKIAKLAVVAFCVLVMRGGIARLSAPAPSLVDIHVESFSAADTNSNGALRIRHRHGRLENGQMVAFRLAGGGVLKVHAQKLAGGMIAMQFMLSDRNGQQSFSTEMTIPKGSAMVLSGASSGQGVLLIRVRPAPRPSVRTDAAIKPGSWRDG